MIMKPRLPAKQGFVEVERNGERLYRELATGALYRPGQMPGVQEETQEEDSSVWEELDRAYQEGVDRV